MKVIIVRGPSNSGKTTTILRVYEHYTQDGARYSVVEEKDSIDGDPKDFSAVIIYEGVKIGFFSMGDRMGDVASALTCYECKQCDILLCACNDRFRSLDRYIDKETAIIVRKESVAHGVTNEIIGLINGCVDEKNNRC